MSKSQLKRLNVQHGMPVMEGIDMERPLDRLVMLHGADEFPELTDSGKRRECVAELRMTGEWLVLMYNEYTEKWMPAYGAPCDELPKWSVVQWTYLDELFAA